MDKFGRLIKIELIKKLHQTSTIVVSLIFIAFCFALPFISNLNYKNDVNISIDTEIKNYEELLQRLRKDNSPDKELIIDQYQAILEVYKNAKESGVVGEDDWRFKLALQLEKLEAARYEVEIILDGKLDPKKEIIPIAGFSLTNNSGLIGKEKPSDEELNSLLEDYSSKINEFSEIIEKNDHAYYYKQPLEQVKAQKADKESQLDKLNSKVDSLSETEKGTVNRLENAIDVYDDLIELYNYCIANKIGGVNNWQKSTIDKMVSNYSFLADLKLTDFEEGIKKYYPSYALSTEEKTEFYQEKIEEIENENLVYWKSIKDSIPVMEIAASTRYESITYLKFVIFIAIILLLIASNIVSGEFSNKNIYMLLIRPVERWKIMASKYITLLILSYTLYFAGLIVFVFSNGIVNGFSDLAYPYFYATGGTVHSVNFFLYLLGQAMFCSVSIVFLVTIAFMMSTLTKNTALAAVTSIGVYFGGLIAYEIILMRVFDSIKVFKYTFLPYMDLSQFVGDTVKYSGTEQFLNPNYGVVHLLVTSVIMFAISLIVFNKRDVKL